MPQAWGPELAGQLPCAMLASSLGDITLRISRWGAELPAPPGWLPGEPRALGGDPGVLVGTNVDPQALGSPSCSRGGSHELLLLEYWGGKKMLLDVAAVGESWCCFSISLVAAVP